jgi:perosamine synthetase
MNPEAVGTVNGAWMPTAVFSPETGITRDYIQAALRAENIDARVFFHPLSSLPMFEDKSLNFNAWDLPNRSINLPSFHDLTDRELSTIVNILISVLIESAC